MSEYNAGDEYNRYWNARYAEGLGICDGCAQPEDECLCDFIYEEASDCDSIYHPGCSKCEVR